MLSPALGATTAIWLLLAPVLELQTGARVPIALALGALALVLSSLATWSRSARAALAVLGTALALVNFVVPGPVGALADFATCGFALIMAGVGPWPVVVPRVAAATPIRRPVRAAEDDTERLRPLRAAA